MTPFTTLGATAAPLLGHEAAFAEPFLKAGYDPTRDANGVVLAKPAARDTTATTADTVVDATAADAPGSGNGGAPHLGGALFESMAGVKLVSVPYKGSGPAMANLMAGQVNYMFGGVSALQPHVQAGKLHALAVMSPQRSPALPNVPTMAESGFADLSLSAWIGLFAPAKTPRPIIDQLNRAVQAALDAEMKAKLAENGMEVSASTPEELQQMVARDLKLHAELVKAAGLVPQ